MCHANHVNSARVLIGWQSPTHVCQSFTRQMRVYQHEKVGENRGKFYLSPTVCQRVCRLFLCRSHAPTWVCQHKFAKLSLSCEGRLRFIFQPIVLRRSAKPTESRADFSVITFIFFVVKILAGLQHLFTIVADDFSGADLGGWIRWLAIPILVPFFNLFIYFLKSIEFFWLINKWNLQIILKWQPKLLFSEYILRFFQFNPPPPHLRS